MRDFVHLHVHSEYSLLDGASRIRDLAAQAAAHGMKALALTDHGVMYGAVAFYKACREHGVKPIIGMEAYMADGSRLDKSAGQSRPIYHLTLLAKNETGYRNLMKLCTIGHLEGYYYRPRIDFEALSRHAEGLICLSGCLKGELSQLLLRDRYDDAKAAALRYRELFGDDYFLELQDHGMPEQRKVAAGLLRLAEETGIPLVVTNDAHYVRQEDHTLQDILLCIGTGKTLDDPDRMKIDSTQLYLKSGSEMAALFRHVPQALENTALIADRCSLDIPIGQQHILPRFHPLPEGETASSYLARLCREGLEARYEGAPEWRDPSFRETALNRLNYELDVIRRMGYDDYFLIVWDFVRFARERGIATGPGRGSAAGSLVSYALRITDVDPLKHKLLFERFLNPERVSMPDIDIDFSDERRDEVIRYVTDKYGADRVAQIITFGTMAARASVRDVGRVMNMPYGEVDRVAKLIPAAPGMSIGRALEESPDFRALVQRDERAAKLIDMAARVEGMPRHASTHAAGVVISPEPLTNHVPLQEGTGGVPLTQYAMEHLEAIGLLKMDFLGLRTLTIIERTLDTVRQTTGREIDWSAVPLDDPATYDLLGRGETTGIFQLESAGMRRVLREMKPTCFEDIVSVLALYRPGPMEFIPRFIAAKHGKIPVEYPHPDLEPILKDTYGIIVYQEQIMQIASAMAGFSLGEADLLRRAVGKKKREVLDEQRAHFVRGSLAQGYSEEEANRVYDMIVRFADYGFCRAHAAAYAVLAFQTAYLKAHHPVAFMASMLTAVVGNQRKTAEYVEDCRRMGIAVLPPDVNESGALFSPVTLRDGTPAIRFGLAAVKNVGTQAIEHLIRERSQRPFESLGDLCRRVDPRVCNKRVIESLLLAGALDSLPGHRAQLLAALDDAMEAAAAWRKEREELQIELFGFEETPNWEVELPEVAPFTSAQTLELERDLMGLYLSGHPLDEYGALLDRLGTDRLADLPEMPDGSPVVTAGMVLSVKPIVTRNGQAMAFLELEDKVTGCELVVFPGVWEKASSFAGKGALVLVKAKLQHGDEDVKLLADDIIPLGSPDAEARVRQWRRIAGRIAGGGPGRMAGGPVSRPHGFGASNGAAAGSSAVPPEGAAPGTGTAPGTSAAPGTVPASGSSPALNHGSASGHGPARGAERRPAGRPGAVSPAPAVSVRQRVYIRIDETHERPAALNRLKKLLLDHPGLVPVVLHYERQRRTVALSDDHRVRPSPELFRQIERLLGEGAVRVK